MGLTRNALSLVWQTDFRTEGATHLKTELVLCGYLLIRLTNID